VKAIILGAGQGKRLLPLTSDRPKSTIELSGRSLLDWQIAQLTRCGIKQIYVVTGFKARVMQDEIAELRLTYPDCTINPIFNPFYAVADNLVSCWMARHAMDEEFILINGDTIFHYGVLQRLLQNPGAPITLAIDKKDHYDEDDMKVHLDGTVLLEIGKNLTTDRIGGESIGMIYFHGRGPEIFVNTLNKLMNSDGALNIWYLSAIGAIAQSNKVATRSIKGLDWCEIDFPVDKTLAEDMVSNWTEKTKSKLVLVAS
ncbi:sugar phosphate nucleotidyltransferase, partial [Pseudomonadota bacterium]